MDAPFSIEGFSFPKLGNTPEEYEDAFSFRKTAKGYRVAVADGATETSFSKLWATLLVENYTRKEIPDDQYLGQLGSVRRLWRQRISKRSLPWYAAEKVSHGAYAAFLGLTLDPKTKRWQALSVGDCCLFHLDTHGTELRVLELFPLTESIQFTNSPQLICSLKEEANPQIKMAEGSLRSEDILLLATDALSAWLMKKNENGDAVWSKITEKELHGEEGFKALAEFAHQDGLKNDDLTLVRIIFREKE